MIYPQGAIIKINFDPTKGHKQQEYRPAMVIQRREVSEIISVTFVIPITHSRTNLPFEIPLPEGMKTNGKLLCRQMRALDLSSRPSEFIEMAPPEIVRECIRYINTMIEFEEN